MSHAQLCHAYPSHFVDYCCLIYLTQWCSVCAKNTAAACVILIKSLHYMHTTLCDIATLTLLCSYAVDYAYVNICTIKCAYNINRLFVPIIVH